jgi:23S rRNA (uracil1939-C5)-methyltransferase
VNEALVERVIEVLAPTTEDAVLDLFCGIGNFSLPLARRARRVLGIEGSAAQVTAAEENARANGIDNAAFLAADLFRPESLEAIPRKTFSLAVIDPPRAGAALLCENLHTLGLRRVAYVSCDAATLARDARTLSAKGFRLLSAGVLQMFPHTSHAESLALFAR